MQAKLLGIQQPHPLWVSHLFFLVEYTIVVLLATQFVGPHRQRAVI